MAHGSPRLNVCHTCKQYTLVSRFSLDPKCPICNKPSEQITKDSLITRYKLSFFDFRWPGFNNWIKITKQMEVR